ncbi:hypothetical protein [Timonella senegalensis]
MTTRVRRTRRSSSRGHWPTSIPGADAGLELPYVTQATRFRAPKEK